MYERVLEGFAEWQYHTCLDFVPTAETDFSKGLLVLSDNTADMCSCPVGFRGNVKHVAKFQGPGGASWTNGCPKWTIVHEGGHSAGMAHTQMRADRATYVTVDPTNTDANYQIWGGKFGFTDEPLVGTTAIEKAEEFYDSLELYYFDGTTMTIAVGWAVDPTNLTTVEQGLRDSWTVSAGQRKHMGTLDARTVNNKYGCFAVNIRDVGDVATIPASFMAPKQTIGQLVSKLGVWLRSDPVSLNLYSTNDLSQEHTAQPLTTTLDALTTPITSASNVTVVYLTNKVTFNYGGNQRNVYVKFGDTLSHVLDVVKYYSKQDFTGNTIQKGSTTLDKTKTLTVLGVVNGDQLIVS